MNGYLSKYSFHIHLKLRRAIFQLKLICFKMFYIEVLTKNKSFVIPTI